MYLLLFLAHEKTFFICIIRWNMNANKSVNIFVTFSSKKKINKLINLFVMYVWPRKKPGSGVKLILISRFVEII